MKKVVRFKWFTPLLFVLLYIVIMILVALLFIFCFSSPTHSSASLIIGLDKIGTLVVIILTLLIIWRFFPVDKKLLDTGVDIKKIPLFIPIACGLFMIHVLVTLLFNVNPKAVEASKLLYIMQLISVIIMAPIFEELLYRGVIFSYLRKQYPFWISALYSSALFAVAHMSFRAMIYTFITGVVLCWILQKEQKIIYCIIIHMIINVLACLTEYFGLFGINKTISII